MDLNNLNIGDTFFDADGEKQIITQKFTDDNDVVYGVAYQPAQY